MKNDEFMLVWFPQKDELKQNLLSFFPNTCPFISQYIKQCNVTTVCVIFQELHYQQQCS